MTKNKSLNLGGKSETCGFLDSVYVSIIGTTISLLHSTSWVGQTKTNMGYIILGQSVCVTDFFTQCIFPSLGVPLGVECTHFSRDHLILPKSIYILIKLHFYDPWANHATLFVESTLRVLGSACNNVTSCSHFWLHLNKSVCLCLLLCFVPQRATVCWTKQLVTVLKFIWLHCT